MSKERPILMSAPMVRALLYGTKTQTRRIVKPQPPATTSSVSTWHHPDEERKGPHFWSWGPDPTRPDADYTQAGWSLPCPYGRRGDHLWVRETWAAPHNCDHLKPREIDMDWRFHYAATEDRGGLLWRPSIHMPRIASRITLEITDVRVERLQEISRGDAMGEGCPFPNMAKGADPRHWYADLWREINGPNSWDANPWVWVIVFKRKRP